MRTHDFHALADQVRGALEWGETVEVVLEPDNGTRYGLVFTPLDIARTSVVEKARERVCRGLGVARGDSESDVPAQADWVLVWHEAGGRGYPFRLLHRDEHDTLHWSHVAENLNLASSDAMVVAAFMCGVARIPHGVENLDQLMAGDPVTV